VSPTSDRERRGPARAFEVAVVVVLKLSTGGSGCCSVIGIDRVAGPVGQVVQEQRRAASRVDTLHQYVWSGSSSCCTSCGSARRSASAAIKSSSPPHPTKQRVQVATLVGHVHRLVRERTGGHERKDKVVGVRGQKPLFATAPV